MDFTQEEQVFPDNNRSTQTAGYTANSSSLLSGLKQNLVYFSHGKKDLLFRNTKNMELNSFSRVYSSEDNEHLLQNKHLPLSPNTYIHTHTMGKNQVHMGSNSSSNISVSLLFGKTEIVSTGQDCHEDQNYYKYLVVLWKWLIHCNYVYERFENINLIFMLFIPSKLYF